MDPISITGLLFILLFALLFSGVHVAFAIGGLSVALCMYFLGPQSLAMVPLRALRSAASFEYTAIPMFIFMASILQRSGVAESLFESMSKFFGRLKGGLAGGTIGICTIFAAMAGISGAATISMGMIAIPEMVKRGYPKRLAMGAVAAGGSLGILIPPSVTMIIYGVISGTSIGQLYVAGILPGLLLAALFTIYVVVYSNVSSTSVDISGERYTWTEKLLSLRGVIVPALLIAAVLGSMLSGFASIGEAAAVGALGAMFFGFFTIRDRYRAYIPLLRECSIETLKHTCMIIWIIISATALSTFYTTIGAPRVIEAAVLSLDVSPYMILAMMMLILLLLGTVLDTVGILMITVPIYAPIADTLGFHPVWFGILYIINMEIGFLTPPFGINLFYLRGVVPSGTTMSDIYASVIPFIAVMLFGLLICAAFPQISLILPSMLF